MPNLSVIRQKSHGLLNRKSHAVLSHIHTHMCWLLINTTALDGDFVAVKLKGESTLNTQLFFLRLRPIQFLSSKHPSTVPVCQKIRKIFFFLLLLPQICDVSPICRKAEMESIERKWPREQPLWFSATASDQLTAFRRKLSRCKKLKQHVTKPQGQTAFDFQHSSLTFLPSDYSAG